MVGEEAVARAMMRELHRDCCEGEALNDICALPLSDGEIEAARAAISVHLEALKAAGWVIIPAEPTQLMNDHGIALLDKIVGDNNVKRGHLNEVYRAMLSAAPPPKTSARDMQRSVNKAVMDEKLSAPPAQKGDEVKP